MLATLFKNACAIPDDARQERPAQNQRGSNTNMALHLGARHPKLPNITFRQTRSKRKRITDKRDGFVRPPPRPTDITPQLG